MTAMADRLSAKRRRALVERLSPPGTVRQGAEGMKTYMLMDAARNRGIYPALLAHQDTLPVRSLYQGELAETLADVCPYVVALDPETEFGRWALDQGWGQAWGLFVRSPLDVDDVRRSLRRFTVVSTEEGRSLLFRFYDPRVLRTFLPTAGADQLGPLFRDVDRFIVEDEGGAVAREFAWMDGQLRSVRHPLEE